MPSFGTVTKTVMTAAICSLAMGNAVAQTPGPAAQGKVVAITGTVQHTEPLSSRLEGVNKEYSTLIIVGEDTWARVSDRFEARELDWIRVKGKRDPVAI